MSQPPPPNEASAAQRSPMAQGEPFGPYTICERLGVGGMATVHRAIERVGAAGADGEREVALKRLLPHLAEDESFVRAFIREAKLASLLEHPNIVQLYELGRVGHVYFISMEYIGGRDLRRVLRQARRVAGPPPLPVVLAIMSQLLDALHYAHARLDEHGQPLGLVHRDVSPSNVLITADGTIKVIDFGIAKAQAQQFRTQTGRVKGKLAYMAPEAITGKPSDARIDLFSAGIIAHELLTARPLFASKNEYQTLLKVQREAILPPSRFNPQCPRELDAVVLKALQRDPDQRFASALAFRTAISAVQRRLGIAAAKGDIEAWCAWAFAQPDPHAGRPGSVDVAGPTQTWRKPRASGSPELPGESGDAREARSDDDIAEEVWGQREQTSGVPVVLDDVPDRSPRAEATIIDLRPGSLTRGQRRRGRSTASFAWASGSSDDAMDRALLDPVDPSPVAVSLGASIVAQAPRRRPYGLALAVVLAASVGSAVWWQGHSRRGVGASSASSSPLSVTSPQSPTTLDTAPSKLRITVVPATAQIEIEGRPAHIGSPYATELAPGEYNLTLSAAGYKPAVLNLSVEPRETLTIHHVLEKASADGKASVVLRFGEQYTARLDETDWQATSPLARELAPGPHELVLKFQGETVWRKQFLAKESASYVFEPTAAELRRRASTSTSTSTSTGDAVLFASDATPTDALDTEASTRAAVTATAASTSVGGEARGPVTSTVAVGRTADEVGTAVSGGAAASASGLGATPKVVPPGSVTRLSGSAPSLRQTRDMPSLISAKLCIDDAGHVSSVAVLGGVSTQPRKEVERALRAWRYRPYLEQARAMPVCFVVSFAVK